MEDEAPEVQHKFVEMNYASIPFANDGSSAPVIFADVIRGVMIGNGVAKISMVDHRLDPLTNEIKAYLVATIAFPAAQMVAWGQYLIRNAGNAAVVAEEGATADTDG